MNISRKILLNTLLTSTFFMVFLSLFGVKNVLAAVRCETQYGGGQVCVKTGELQVNKKVWNPSRSEYVDNLGLASPYRFIPGAEVKFLLEVKNVGDETLNNVRVTDILPFWPEDNSKGFLELVSGSLENNLGSLAPGEKKEVTLITKVVSANKLRPNRNIDCDVINVAEARADNQFDRDTAQICIQKEVTTAPKGLPKAGPEEWSLMLGLSLIAGTTGFYLKHLAKI